MNKSDIINQVAKETGIEIKIVHIIFNSIIDTIHKNILFGINIKIQGFLNFTLKIKKERLMHNPNTKEKVLIPKHYGLKLTVAKVFSDKLKKKIVY